MTSWTCFRTVIRSFSSTAFVELDTEAGRVVALKNVTANEPQFTGHFPGVPVMPAF